IFWKGATRSGALAGLSAGFLVWVYTLLLPAFARSGWLPLGLLENGPFGFALLKPLQLFGLVGLDQITHAMIWSMIANVGAYVGFSLLASPTADEHRQASLFVDVFKRGAAAGGASFWRGTASAPDLHGLLARFLGEGAADGIFHGYAQTRGLRWPDDALVADAEFVHYVETKLAGAIGASSSRIMVAAVVKEDALTVEEVRQIVDEASQVVAYSHKLEQKSIELEAATAELRAANERLQELDRLKDDFVSTVSHELRTPLTSIRSFSEILREDPEVDLAQRKKFLDIITRETERLTRLINEILDLSKLESGTSEWRESMLDLREIIEATVSATSQLFKEKAVLLDSQLPSALPRLLADRDRVTQVIFNLLSNAVKFCESGTGRVLVRLSREGDALRVDVTDNGPGISQKDQKVIFEKFRQAGGPLSAKPRGTGLGLHISSVIVEHLGGRIWVTSHPGAGATFSFSLPLVRRGVQVEST
ncbi:MAG: ATP-binding protein, partial [Betaproteobacteria bacterium]